MDEEFYRRQHIRAMKATEKYLAHCLDMAEKDTLDSRFNRDLEETAFSFPCIFDCAYGITGKESLIIRDKNMLIDAYFNPSLIFILGNKRGKLTVTHFSGKLGYGFLAI